MKYVELFDWVHWAHERCRESLPNDPPEFVRAMYAHVVAAEVHWVCRIDGEPVTLDVFPDFDVAEADRHRERILGQLDAHVARADSGDDRQRIQYENSQGDPFSSTLGEILFHLATHGHYHRGQIASALRDEGFDPATTDLIFKTRR